jgi:hypothetical protein
MTKRVRIENADGGSARVLVEVWQRGYPEGEPDKLIESRELNHCADLAELYIHAGRYLKVLELAPAAR